MGGAASGEGREIFLRWMEAGLQALEREKAAIDALNVFPVPDGDTGTNMFLTFSAAWKEVQKDLHGRLRDLVQAASRGALMGARGNSGVILSQFFRGFARSIAAAPPGAPLDGARLAHALEEAAQTAYQAVIKPVEGTMLTVGRAAARWAERAARRPGASLVEVLEAASEGAKIALARTPRQLPVLAQAGVVDAGGQGLVVLLEAALQASRQAPAPPAAAAADRSHPAAAAVPRETAEGAMPGHEPGGITETYVRYRYCTEFLIMGQGIPQEQVREALLPLGDSLLVVGDPSLLKVHVHTNHPGRALEVGVRWGELLNVSVNNMQEQNRQAARRKKEQRAAALAGPPAEGSSRMASQVSPGRSGPATPPSSSGRALAPQAAPVGVRVSDPPAGNHRPSRAAPADLAARANHGATGRVAIVAVVSGDGLKDIFRSLGVEQLVDGGSTMNPSTEELVKAVEASPAAGVILLPNNKNVVMAARQVPAIASKPVIVVPSRNIPEGLAAALAFSGELGLEANAARMERALERVASGEVTYAVRDSHFGDHEIRAGDIVGMADGELVSVGQDVGEVVYQVARRLLGDGKTLLTLYYGREVDRAQAQRLLDTLKGRLDGTEIELYFGGQPIFYYILSAE
ncbi:DAK2 domain-containing protein [Carboxydochorda subterranea]|uniref:DAK2 domain-containing protein n=1 Tax=Carboxydichorda subterranea TaxID=3109565 RepID=A0ABZ1C0D8_9FIRM|nr:DAK2 domain-containing protein [Limnochorda sp. L945t]WRP18409.1 DAK2 domain-containing protein [Limnochorda sp. L945t]